MVKASALSLVSGPFHRFHFYMGISISGVRVWVYIPLHAARVVVLREECLVVILSCNFSSLVSCLIGSETRIPKGDQRVLSFTAKVT